MSGLDGAAQRAWLASARWRREFPELQAAEAEDHWRSVARAVIGDLDVAAQRLYEEVDAYVQWSSLDEADRNVWRRGASAVLGAEKVESEAVVAAVMQLAAMPTDDPEQAHAIAEEILLSVAPSEVADAYRKLRERAPWWAAA